MAPKVQKRLRTRSVQRPNSQPQSQCVSLNYNWHSFPEPRDESENTVITVHQAPLNGGPAIPLLPVFDNNEPEQPSNSEPLIPWRLVSCRVPAPQFETEKPVTQSSRWGDIKVVNAHEEEDVPKPISSAAQRHLAHCRAAFDRAMRQHVSPIRFKISQASQQEAAALPSSTSQPAVQHMQPSKRWTGEQWLNAANKMSNIFIPTKDSVLYQSFQLQSQEIFHRAFKLHDQRSLIISLEVVRMFKKEQHKISDNNRFMYRGNICEICDSCKGKECHWNYSCKLCFLPQPVCFLQVKRSVLAADSTTPCDGCPSCKYVKLQFKHSQRRLACVVCKDIPQPRGSVQPIAHCAVHCRHKRSSLDPQLAGNASGAAKSYPKSCVFCGQLHNAAVCRNLTTIQKLLNKRRRDRSLLHVIQKSKPKLHVVQFHSEADSNTLPHFKSGSFNQGRCYRKL